MRSLSWGTVHLALLHRPIWQPLRLVMRTIQLSATDVVRCRIPFVRLASPGWSGLTSVGRAVTSVVSARETNRVSDTSRSFSRFRRSVLPRRPPPCQTLPFHAHGERSCPTGRDERPCLTDRDERSCPTDRDERPCPTGYLLPGAPTAPESSVRVRRCRCHSIAASPGVASGRSPAPGSR